LIGRPLWAEAVWKLLSVWYAFAGQAEAGMAGFIEGVDRGQSVLFPDRLDDWIGEDSLVRVVDLFVEELDLQRLGFARSAPRGLDGLAITLLCCSSCSSTAT
jgi:hypothetical protein